MKDFFISYTKTDKNMAEWIAYILEKEGYSTIIQEWDFCAGENFLLKMDESIMNAKCLVLVLSDNYMKSPWCRAEWIAKLGEQIISGERKILPIRIEPVEIKGLLSTIIYADIVGKTEYEAKETILKEIRNGRKKKVLYVPNYNVQHISICNTYHIYTDHIELYKKCRTKILVSGLRSIHNRITWFSNETIDVVSLTENVSVEILELRDTNTNYNVVFSNCFEEGAEVEYMIKAVMSNKNKQFKDFVSTEIITPLNELNITVEIKDKKVNKMYTQKLLSSVMNNRNEPPVEHNVASRIDWNIENPEMHCEYKVFW